MSDETNQKMGLSATDWEIGFHNGTEVMIVTIPLRAWAEDFKDGDIKASGVFLKAERIAIKNIQVIRQQIKEKGLVAPAGVIPVPRGRMA